MIWGQGEAEGGLKGEGGGVFVLRGRLEAVGGVWGLFGSFWGVFGAGLVPLGEFGGGLLGLDQIPWGYFGGICWGEGVDSIFGGFWRQIGSHMEAWGVVWIP